MCSTHQFKYRLAYIVDGICVVRYDNERKKVIIDITERKILPIPLLVQSNWSLILNKI